MGETLQAFRARVVELLAGTEHAVAWSEETKVDHAKRLGVAVDVLDEARAMARGRRRGPGPASSSPVFFEVLCRPTLCRPLSALAHELHMETTDLFRSLLHAVLQTPREPFPRSSRRLGPLYGREAVRARLDTKATGGKRPIHFKFKVTRGFLVALGQRASAFGGNTPLQYARRWLADLVDGLLPDLSLVPVSAAELFEDARLYVLPKLTETPDPDRVAR